MFHQDLSQLNASRFSEMLEGRDVTTPAGLERFVKYGRIEAAMGTILVAALMQMYLLRIFM